MRRIAAEPRREIGERREGPKHDLAERKGQSPSGGDGEEREVGRKTRRAARLLHDAPMIEAALFECQRRQAGPSRQKK